MSAGTSKVALQQGEIPRRYLLHAPPGEPPAGGWPAVLVLHGMGGTAAWTLAETGLESFADEAGVVLIVPEALPRDPARPPAFWKNPTAWRDDVDFLDAALADAARRRPLDPRRLFATGFSNGAAMVFRLAVERPNLFAAIAPVAGYCRVPLPPPLPPLPTLYLVGDADPYVPLQGGRVETVWGWSEDRPALAAMLGTWSLAQGGAQMPDVLEDTAAARVERYAHPTVELRSVIIKGLGHHWPGGRGQLSRRLFGPPGKQVDANRLMGEFFRLL